MSITTTGCILCGEATYSDTITVIDGIAGAVCFDCEFWEGTPTVDPTPTVDHLREHLQSIAGTVTPANVLVLAPVIAALRRAIAASEGI